jgi:hypothetical protein
MKIVAAFLSMAFIISGCKEPCLMFNGGHSHNDYYQPQPLFSALENGMVSIEADIFLRNGKLLVGHSEDELIEKNTLVNMYLKPLHDIIVNETVNINQVILLIDIKDNGEATYGALKEAIMPFKEMLTQFRNGKIEKRTVTIIISGARPKKTVCAESQRYVFIDGRFLDDDLAAPSTCIPLISDDWKKYFKWDGEGEMPESEHEKLKEMVKLCHKKNKMVRFWGIPEQHENNQKIWEVLHSAKVNLIGSDCPICLKTFFDNYN